MKWLLVLVLVAQADGREITNAVTIDNYNTEAECKVALRAHLSTLADGVYVDYAGCQQDHRTQRST